MPQKQKTTTNTQAGLSWGSLLIATPIVIFLALTVISRILSNYPTQTSQFIENVSIAAAAALALIILCINSPRTSLKTGASDHSPGPARNPDSKPRNGSETRRSSSAGVSGNDDKPIINVRPLPQFDATIPEEKEAAQIIAAARIETLTLDELKSLRHNIARRLHPDLGGLDRAHARTHALAKANTVLDQAVRSHKTR